MGTDTALYVTPIYRLIYVSHMSHPLSDADMAQISQSASRNNARMGISGLLIECAGEFLQILEGEEKAVKTLFEHIEKDPRHQNISTLGVESTQSRLFPDWGMGCFAFRPEDLPNGFLFKDENGEKHLRPDIFLRADDLLKTFYEENHATGLSKSFIAPPEMA